MSSRDAQGLSAAPLKAETLHPALERRWLEAENLRGALLCIDPAFGGGEDGSNVASLDFVDGDETLVRGRASPP